MLLRLNCEGLGAPLYPDQVMILQFYWQILAGFVAWGVTVYTLQIKSERF